MHRREATQRFVRAVLVVIDPPSIGNGPDLLKVGEQVRVEHLGSIRSIEALNESVLIHWANAAEIISGPLSSRIASGGP